MNDRHVGTCSLCGGRVMLPSIWHAVVPPTPTCERCYATARQPEMPVMPMEPARRGHALIGDVEPLAENFRASGEMVDAAAEKIRREE